MRNIKTIIIPLLLLCSSAVCSAQIRWVNPVEAGAEVHGQGWESLCHSYVRLPDEARQTVREIVWDLSRNSSGLSLVFRSNASEILVRYKALRRNYNTFHMSSMGASGVDLFAIDDDGSEFWMAPDFTPQFKDTISFRYSGITYRNQEFYEYHLYLPNYNGITWMEIGVPEDSNLIFVKRSNDKPVVIYGTSIAQGACASRSGQTWVNRLGRQLRLPVVNLGLSGNGKLESEVFDLLNQIDACIYVIDCMQNNTIKHPICERTVAGVRKLRTMHDCPILLVEHSGYPQETTKSESSSYRLSNDELRKAYNILLNEGVKGLYYMTHEEMGYTTEEMVEGVHPNDLGMKHCANAYEQKIKTILK